MNTSLNIIQLPLTVPSLVKGQIITQPLFGTQKWTRISDETDSPYTIKTGEANVGAWNANDTLFMAKVHGGELLLFQFDPASMQARVIPFIPPGPNCSYAFSRTAAGFLYMLCGTKILQIKFSQSGGTWIQGPTSPVFDFASLLPSGFKPAWSSLFRVSQDDGSFTVGFSEGPQDTCYLVCSYERGHAGKGHRLLNTETGQIDLHPVSITSVALKFPFYLHEVIQSPNPSYALLDPIGQSSQIVWHLYTSLLADPHISGHTAYGWLSFYNGGPGGGQIQEVIYNNLTSRFLIPKAKLPQNQSPPQTYQGDQHFAIGKIDPLDDTIIWISSQSEVSPFTSCWMNEVRGCQIRDGTVLRAGHTFNTGLSDDFDTANAMAVPSQSGRFVALSTDWGQTWKNKRGDIVVIKVG